MLRNGRYNVGVEGSVLLKVYVLLPIFFLYYDSTSLTHILSTLCPFMVTFSKPSSDSHLSFPLDIIYEILKWACKSNVPITDLKSYSLISKNWTAPSQKLIFQTLEVASHFASTLVVRTGALSMYASNWSTEDKHSLFVKEFSEPQVIQFVQHARFDAELMAPLVENWPSLFSIGFTNLQSLSITDFNSMTCEDYSGPHIDAFCKMISRNFRLNELVIYNQSFPCILAILDIVASLTTVFNGRTGIIGFDDLDLGYTLGLERVVDQWMTTLAPSHMQPLSIHSLHLGPFYEEKTHWDAVITDTRLFDLSRLTHLQTGGLETFRDWRRVFGAIGHNLVEYRFGFGVGE
jgi:hypothetical protein